MRRPSPAAKTAALASACGKATIYPPSIDVSDEEAFIPRIAKKVRYPEQVRG